MATYLRPPWANDSGPATDGGGQRVGQSGGGHIADVGVTHGAGSSGLPGDPRRAAEGAESEAPLLAGEGQRHGSAAEAHAPLGCPAATLAPWGRGRCCWMAQPPIHMRSRIAPSLPRLLLEPLPGPPAPPRLQRRRTRGRARIRLPALGGVQPWVLGPQAQEEMAGWQKQR